MSLVFLTGGARSGKSSAGSEMARLRSLDGMSVTVAVFGNAHGDSEFEARIAAHVADRPRNFSTLECGEDPHAALGVPDDTLLFVDCLGTALGAIMLQCMIEQGAELSDAPADALPLACELMVEEYFDRFVAALMERGGDTIVVSNEVGSGVVPLYASARIFRDLLGRANRRLVSSADAAFMCIAGRLLDLKALPVSAGWPED